MRRLLLLSLSLLIVALAGWTAFGAAPAIQGDVITGVDAEQGVYIRFWTERAAMARVEYGVGDELTEMTSEKTSLDGSFEFFIADVAVDTTYSFRIHVRDWTGEGYATEIMTFDTPPLSAPDNLRAITRDEQATISWDAVFGAAAYAVERADAAGGDFVEIATVESASYTDRSVQNHAEYRYRVRAVDEGGSASEPSAELHVLIEPAIVNETFDGPLNMDVWAIYDWSKGANIETRNGHLVFENFDQGGWNTNIAGIVLRDKIDLTGVKTVIEIDYVTHNWTELNPGFFETYIEGGYDIFDEIGFRITVEPSRIDTRIAHGGNGQFSPSFGWTNVKTAPYTLRWELTHREGPWFDHAVFIDNALIFQGQVNIGTINPAGLHFYFWVANDAHMGPSAVDRLVIYQE